MKWRGNDGATTTLAANAFTYTVAGTQSTTVTGTILAGYQGTLYQYDAQGNVTAVSDPRGNSTVTAYDVLDRKVQTMVLAGTAQTASLTITGTATSTVTVTLANHGFVTGDEVLINSSEWSGPAPITVLDANTFSLTLSGALSAGTISGTVQKVVARATYGYDADGNVISSGDALGNITTYQYDALNRKTAEIDPTVTDAVSGQQVAPTTTYKYDADGNVISVTDPRGNQSGASTAAYTTTYQYDALNRMTAKVQPDTGDGNGPPTTTYGYDADGNVVAVTDPRGNQSGNSAAAYTTQYQYDALNRKIAEIDPVVSVVSVVNGVVSAQQAAPTTT